MPPRLLPFATLIDRLAQQYGEPAPPVVTEPFAMILWENVAYLANDAKRAEAFAELQKKVGLSPRDIRKAKDSVLLAIAGKGIVPAATVEKLRRAAEIAGNEFSDDLTPILDKPLTAAKKDLRKFPAIGEPAAEKILLFNRRHAPSCFGIERTARAGAAGLRARAQELRHYLQEHAACAGAAIAVELRCANPRLSASATARAGIVQANIATMRTLPVAGKLLVLRRVSSNIVRPRNWRLQAALVNNLQNSAFALVSFGRTIHPIRLSSPLSQGRNAGL